MRIPSALTILKLCVAFGFAVPAYATTGNSAQVSTAPAVIDLGAPYSIAPSATPVAADMPSEGHAEAGPVEPVATPEANSLSGSASIEIAHKRQFPQQQLNYSNDPGLAAYAEGCVGSACLSIWNFQTLAGNEADNEFDLCGSYTAGVGGGFRLTGEACHFWVMGPEAWSASATISTSISDRCEAGLELEVLRGSFVDNVAEAKVSCSEIPVRIPFIGSAVADFAPGIALSDYANGIGGTLSGGLDFPVADNANLRIAAEVFGGTRDAGASFTFGFNVSF